MTPQRLDIGYRITWKGRWHVGSGYQSAAADRLQQRSADDAPFVPGSQVKGALRHQCERLANAHGIETVDPHDVRRRRRNRRPAAGAEEGDRNLVKHFRPLAKSGLLIDRLFGSRYQGECVFVTNAEPAKQEPQSTIAVAARTAIDRVTGTVMEQHLFTTETVATGPDLHGTIRARHPAGVLTPEEDGQGFPYEYALLVAGLLTLETLGGGKSVGLGRCALEVKSLCWNNADTKIETALASFQEPDWAVLVNMVREEMA